MVITPHEISSFHYLIFSWWMTNKRDLPWRLTTDPYKILVSEFMLQQTQVNRVIPKYLDFLMHFPTIADLAKSSRKMVLQVWTGLGYNRRAIWLSEIAKEINSKEEFPLEPQVLMRYKGIGDYTSRSIPIFASNLDYAAVDVNIKRVMIFHKFANLETKPKQFQSIAESLLPLGKARDWHNALMDYGATAVPKFKVSKAVQGKFEGSSRQIRGKIIRLLSIQDPNDKMSEMQISQAISVTNVSDILFQLVNENMINCHQGLYFV